MVHRFIIKPKLHSRQLLVLVVATLLSGALFFALFPANAAALDKTDCEKAGSSSKIKACKSAYDNCNSAADKHSPGGVAGCRSDVFDSYGITDTPASGGRSNCSKAGAQQSDCETAYDKCATNPSPDRVSDCQQQVLERYSVATAAQKIDFSGFSGKGKTYQCGKRVLAGEGEAGKTDSDKEKDDVVYTKFNFGCLGDKYTGGNTFSPILDLTYAIIRFMSAGVGVMIIIAIIAAGIRYTLAEGNPEASMAAKSQIRGAIIALFVYIFSYSILQYLTPGGIFNPGQWLTSPPEYLLDILGIR
jgi:hypothetical protein